LAGGAVIVTHNSEEVILGCIDALAEMAPGMTATVIDNASTDRTLNQVRLRPQVKVIANQDNRGFAGAVNQGLRAVEADPILLLNPDVWLSTPLTALVEACQQHGLAAGQLTEADGRPQSGFTIRRFPTPAALIFELLGINRLWPGNPVNRHYRYLDRDLKQAGPVDQPAGAFLMIRRDVWERLEGFDEEFHPVWFEDVDFCRRAVHAGYSISYTPQVRARHRGGHSVKKLPAARMQVYWYDSLIRYAAKHFRSVSYRSVCAAALLGAVPRAVLGMIRERSLEPFFISNKTMQLAGRRLLSRQKRTQQSERTQKT
jgi:N-acetylglucosaminyl-diphospho-decaprenol L-rhamnosyltransferase